MSTVDTFADASRTDTALARHGPASLWSQRLPLALPLDTKEPLVFLLLAALSSGLLIAISSLSFLYIEKPGMAAGKRLVRRLRQRTRTTSQVEPE